MEAVVMKEAMVLLPCLSSKNFRDSGERIPEGALVKGNIRMVDGLNRGKPFRYTLFYTDDNKIIFLKNIKPMRTTEINIGADAAQSPTNINLPNVSNLGYRPVVGTILGIAAGYGLAKYRKVSSKHKLVVFAAIGGVVGFIAGKYWQSKVSLTVKPSK